MISWSAEVGVAERGREASNEAGLEAVGSVGVRNPSVLFINQHYWPDVASTGQHLTDIAEFLASEGYQVTVLTGGATYLARARNAPRAETRNGVSVRRVRTTRFGRGCHVGRLADYASFYLYVVGALMSPRRHDVVVFLTTPPLMMVLGAIAKRLRAQRYGVWSMDLHPDAEIAAGMIKQTSLITRVLMSLMAAGYRNADFVIDLGRFMKARLVAKGVDPSRLHTVPVWSKADEIAPVPPEKNPLRKALALETKFVVMYSGNAGMVHEFGPVLDAMRALRDDQRIFWLFVGGGPQRSKIEKFISANGIRNFRYVDYFARENLHDTISLADVHLVTLKTAFAGIAVPGKLYGIMAAARPVVFVGPSECETAEAIRNAGCGVVLDDPKAAPKALVAHLRRFANDSGVLATLGAAGRRAFMTNYQAAVVLPRFRQILSRALR